MNSFFFLTILSAAHTGTAVTDTTVWPHTVPHTLGFNPGHVIEVAASIENPLDPVKLSNSVKIPFLSVLWNTFRSSPFEPDIVTTTTKSSKENSSSDISPCSTQYFAICSPCSLLSYFFTTSGVIPLSRSSKYTVSSSSPSVTALSQISLSLDGMSISASVSTYTRWPAA